LTTYALRTGRYTDAATLQKAVGQIYHLGLSCVLPDTTSRFYGYILEPDNSKNGGFRQRSDTQTRDSLVNYGSPNLVDRDLAVKPRVTDGDFSGGGYQEVWIDPKRYFDSDLDPRTPGYLQLRPTWNRVTKALGAVGTTSWQVVAFKGDYWASFGENAGNIYSANGATTTTPAAQSILSLDTDGSYLYAGTAAGLWRSSDGAAWTAVTSSVNGTPNAWWVVSQGTNGYFAYYRTTAAGAQGNNLLYKIDLTTGFPIAAAAQPQIPVGGNAFNVIDLCEYQTSIAIVTTDVRGSGFDVWYFDGANFTRIVRVDGYLAQGMCQALGSLYIGASALIKTYSPILVQIDNGTYNIVAKPGSPFLSDLQTCLQPRSSSQHVYWPILNPSINGISSAPGVIVQYDALSGAVMHLPNAATDDFTSQASGGLGQGGPLRQIALLGENVAMVSTVGTNGIIDWQQPAFVGANVTYKPSGWLVSSHIDFATPGITKRFRRIEVHHAPLAANEQIFVEAFVDTDPLVFTTVLPPVPSGASATNVTVGSSLTALTFGADTIGKTLYFALKVTYGANNKSPRISYVSIEVGGTWTWEITLTCTSKTALLDGQNEDQQGVTGKDLAYLLLLAYENGSNLTLYHRNGQQYIVAIESLDAWNPSPILAHAPQEARDEEWMVHCILRQIA
jgi:hypothetical protein